MEVNGLGIGRGNSRVKKLVILFDTNMLLLVANSINVFEQIEERIGVKPDYIVLKPIIGELEKLVKSGKPSISRKARFALSIVKEYCRIIDVDLEYSSIDDLIIKYAEKNKVVVATCDKKLRRELRKRGLPNIYLREEKMMIETEGLEI